MTTNMAERCLTEQAYERIKRGILNGSYPPGSDLTELGLAESLGFGRMPVHNALKQLQHEGWVEAGFRCKTRVKSVNRQEVEELYQLRRLFELPALDAVFDQKRNWDYSFLLEEKLVRMRAGCDDFFRLESADAEMHLALVGVFDNQRLTGFYQSVVEQMIFLALNNAMLREDLVSYLEQSLNGWHDIIDSIRHLQQKAAHDGLLAHLEGARRRALSFYA